MSEALHQAKLLQGQLVRLDATRKRRVERANADYRVDLLALISKIDPSILEIVQHALDHDRESPSLAADLRNAIWRRSNPRPLPLDIAEQVMSEREREADTLIPESDDIPPPLPYRPGQLVKLDHLDQGSDEPVPTPRVPGAGRDPWGLTPEGAPSSEANGL